MLNNSETTLKWSDFLLIDEAGFMSTKAGTFYSATYSATKTPVTLLVSPAPVSPTDILPDTSSPSSSSHKTDAFSLSPVSKFISEDASAEFMSSTPADKGILTLLQSFIRGEKEIGIAILNMYLKSKVKKLNFGLRIRLRKGFVARFKFGNVFL